MVRKFKDFDFVSFGGVAFVMWNRQVFSLFLARDPSETSRWLGHLLSEVEETPTDTFLHEFSWKVRFAGFAYRTVRESGKDSDRDLALSLAGYR